MRLLIADDDVELCEILCRYFELDGIKLDCIHRGDVVVPTLQKTPYDLLILDIMLPGLNGLDVLREIRRSNTTPVLMLSARGEEMDRIIGLELGADDYMPKPCSPRELAARARSILRRTQTLPDTTTTSVPNSVRVGDLELHPAARQVICSGKQIELTGAEFSVLHELLKSPGQVISKKDLFKQALGKRMQAFDRSLDMHISNLRKKLGKHPDGRVRISAVRGAGYIYVVPPKI